MELVSEVSHSFEIKGDLIAIEITYVWLPHPINHLLQHWNQGYNMSY